MARVEYYIGTEGPFFLDDANPLWSDARQIARRADLESYLKIADIADNLTTNDALKVLSAKQGKVLKDLVDLNNNRKDQIQLVNKTGAVSVAGTVVTIDSTTTLAVKSIVVDVPNPIGVIVEAGIADGAAVWVQISGVAQVLYGNAVSAGWLGRGFVNTDAGYVSGKAIGEAFPTAPFATDKHFYEIGHIAETTAAPGLAWTLLHFN